MNATEDALYLAIINGQAPADPEFYARGWNDHALGKQFHEGPPDAYTVPALSWRIGWNARALSESHWKTR